MGTPKKGIVDSVMWNEGHAYMQFTQKYNVEVMSVVPLEGP